MPDDIVFDGGSEADRREIMNALFALDNRASAEQIRSVSASRP